MEKYKDKIQKEYHLVRSEFPVYQELRTFSSLHMSSCISKTTRKRKL